MQSQARMRISSRLLLLNAVIALPLLVIILWLVVSGIQPNIAFATREAQGIAFLRPLLQLSAGLPVAGWSRQGNLPTMSAFDPEAEFSALRAAHAKHGMDLATTESGLRQRNRESALVPTALHQDWQTNRAAAPAQLAPLLERLRNLTTHVGDTSNLILDPDLDSYYLMDAALLGLPQLLATTRAWHDDERAAERDLQAAILTRIDLPRIISSLETALTEDARFYGISPSLRTTLEPRLARLKSAGESVQAAHRKGLDRTAAAIALHSAAAELGDSLCQELDILLATRSAHYRRNLRNSLLATAAVFLAAALIGYSIRRSIVRTLHWLSAEMHEASETAEKHATAMLSISESIANAACANAAALQQTHATAHQFVHATEKNFETISAATETTRQTHTLCETGAAATRRLRSAIDRLKSESNAVHDILKTIDEIAFQTNLLALNAAVEAARAGSAGAGFAVVAGEVRSLAQRAASSARETNDRLGQIVQQTAESATLTAEVQAQLEHIFADTKTVDVVARSVAASCREQADKVRGMVGSLETLDQQTQQFAARAEEAAATSTEVGQQAHQLKGAVEQLAVFVDGHRYHSSPAHLGPATSNQENAAPQARVMAAEPSSPATPLRKKAASLRPAAELADASR